MKNTRIGLVLGGGGARGMAHIPIIEAFDELGIKPSHIVGTSIGSILGAGYASGLSGKEIKEIAESTFSNYKQIAVNFWKLGPQSIWSSIAGGKIPQLDARQALELYVGDKIPDDFDQLQIPLSIAATDFLSSEGVHFQSGCLKSAIAASMAIPVMFKPVIHQNRLFVDGGVTNPLPIDLLPADIDSIVAVDAIGTLAANAESLQPSANEMIFGSIQIMMHTISRQKLEKFPDAILIRPRIDGFRMLDFFKTKQIVKASTIEKEKLKVKLEEILNGH